MYQYRITKYNPIYRNEKGFYLRDEWTDYSDIGKLFDGKALDKTEYFKVENSYINVIKILMNLCNVKVLKIKNLEIKDYNINKEIKIKNNIKLLANQIQKFAQYCLRNRIWCKFELKGSMYVHFGYDYYMFIGCNISYDKVSEICRQNDLFCENFVSPYSHK